jgi:hypothetical protein
MKRRKGAKISKEVVPVCSRELVMQGEQHAIALNHAVSVRAPKSSVVEGKTPALSVAQARQLPASTDPEADL